MAGLVVIEASFAGNPTTVGSSNTNVVLLKANPARRGATVFNDSTAILYLLLADAAASTSKYTVQMVAGSYYEVPYNYAGPINGIWASVNGNARIVEHL